jgi:hypothetical protein
MNIARAFNKSKAPRQRATAVLVIVVFIGCITLLLLSNTRALAALKQELNLLNAKQQMKYGQSAKH